MIFNLPPILGLLPLILYIVLAFNKKIPPVLNVLICVVLGAIMNKENIATIGTRVYESLGAFLGLVGFIIMLGAGLGKVLQETGVADGIVRLLVNKIGVKTKKRAIICTGICSCVMVALLGTLAGANAVIVPIVIPLVAAVGITPSTLAVILQGIGQTGLFLSPFSPPMVTMMGITGLTYPQVLFTCSLPICVIMWIGTYLVALHVQKKTEGTEDFGEDAKTNIDTSFESLSPVTKRSTYVFLASMLALIVWGVAIKGGAPFVIVVMFTETILVGVVAKMPITKVFDNFFLGASKNLWLFVMTVLFNPFLNYVDQTGAFSALVDLTSPVLGSAGVLGFTLAVILIGIFGINGAAVAQAMMIAKLFGDFVPTLGISANLWCLIILIGHQITSFAYPGIDMIGAMGMARCKNLKPMMQLAYFAIIPFTVLYGCIAALLY